MFTLLITLIKVMIDTYFNAELICISRPIVVEM